jgi:flagellar hook-associated protein 2
MAGVQIAGLASGFNWQLIINDLITADSAGVNQVQAQQNQVNAQVTALGAINTDLTNLTNSVYALEDPSLYSGVTVTSNNPNSTWQGTAPSGTTPGNYSIAVTGLATASTLMGATRISQPLNSSDDVSGLTIANLATAQPVTAGTFTVNGEPVTVTTSESLADVFTAIGNATGGTVTAGYDSGSDSVTLTSTAGPIVLGADNDTSNFLQEMKLQNNGTNQISSSARVGSLNVNDSIATCGLLTPLTGLDSSGNGSLVINGVTIDYNANTDTLGTLLSRITNSNAGVTATYNATDNQVILTNSATGDTGMGVSDSAGNNLMAALGLTSAAGATLVTGANAKYSVNGGPVQTSASNTLSPTALGVPGLTVTVDTLDTQTIEVATNTSGIQTAIQNFITSFNQLQSDITNDTAVSVSSSGTIVTSVLSANYEISDWASSLQMDAFSAGNALPGPINSLDSLGIDFNGTTGQLEISDQGALSAALTNNPSGVAAFFQTATTGFGSVMNKAITDTMSQETSEASSLTSEASDLGDQITTMQSQLASEQASLEAEFSAMETMEAQYQSEEAALNGISGSTSSSAVSNPISTANISIGGQSISGSSTSSSGTSSTDSSSSTSGSTS